MDYATVASNEFTVQAVKALSCAIIMAVAIYGGTSAQGKVASTTFEGIARNPSAADKIGGNFIIGMALIESLVIFGLAALFLLKP